MAAFYAIMGAVLMLAAGWLDWTDAWVFLIVYFCVAAAGQTWLIRIDPSLVRERSSWGGNTIA